MPFRKTVGRIYYQHIYSGIYQGRYPFFKVAAVNSGSDHQFFMAVEQFIGIFYMIVVVFAEDKILKSLIVVYNRKAIQLMIPDDRIGFT